MHWCCDIVPAAAYDQTGQKQFDLSDMLLKLHSRAEDSRNEYKIGFLVYVVMLILDLILRLHCKG